MLPQVSVSDGRSQSNKIFECLRCLLPSTRASNSQKYCTDCRFVLRSEWNETAERNRQRQRGGPRLGLMVECVDCQVKFVKKSGSQRLCPTCRAGEKKQYQREKQRSYNGVILPIGSRIACRGCGIQIIKHSGLQRYCGPCRINSQRASDRNVYRSRQNHPVAIFGEVMACTRCGADTIRKGAGQKFCAYCRIIAKTEYCRILQARRLAASPRARLNARIGSAISRSLRGAKAGKRWEALVGYSLQQLMRHLERQFVTGMSFANYGRWHVDHIIPLALHRFKTANDPEFHAVWSLSNLRPLWATDNLQKHNIRTHLL